MYPQSAKTHTDTSALKIFSQACSIALPHTKFSSELTFEKFYCYCIQTRERSEKTTVSNIFSERSHVIMHFGTLWIQICSSIFVWTSLITWLMTCKPPVYVCTHREPKCIMACECDMWALYMTVSTEIATPPESTKSRYSDFSVSRGTNSNWDFVLTWLCTEEFEFLDCVDFRGVAFQWKLSYVCARSARMCNDVW